MNEHPVTIYPGRSSPVKSKSTTNRKIVGSTHDITNKLLALNIKDNESSDTEDDDDDNELDDQQMRSNEIISGDNASGAIKIIPQSVSLSNFNNCHDKLQSEEEFSDDSLENLNIEIEPTQSENCLLPPPPLDNEIPIMPEKCSPGIAWEIKMDGNINSEIPLKVSKDLLKI